jgi:hypothetical protein
MAAGDNLSLTNVLVGAFGTPKELTVVAADADTADLAQTFVYTATGKANKFAFIIYNTTGTLTYTVNAGTGVMQGAAKTGTVAANKNWLLQVETGRYKKGATIELKLTPASGTKLLTNHAAKVSVIELL